MKLCDDLKGVLAFQKSNDRSFMRIPSGLFDGCDRGLGRESSATETKQPRLAPSVLPRQSNAPQPSRSVDLPLTKMARFSGSEFDNLPVENPQWVPSILNWGQGIVDKLPANLNND
jgi:hypothetical protein